MNTQNNKEISKLLSLILRHKPQTIGLSIDENGWAEIDELISKLNQHGHSCSKATLEEIVTTNDKQRFAFDATHTRIRANQGHSINVDVEMETKEPPAFLYHGTVKKFLEKIRTGGLQKMKRQHVHLSKDKETAQKVGSRRGEAIILTVQSGKMHTDGMVFYLSSNGVWLTDHVPEQYIDFTSAD